MLNINYVLCKETDGELNVLSDDRDNYILFSSIQELQIYCNENNINLEDFIKNDDVSFVPLFLVEKPLINFDGTAEMEELNDIRSEVSLCHHCRSFGNCEILNNLRKNTTFKHSIGMIISQCNKWMPTDKEADNYQIDDMFENYENDDNDEYLEIINFNDIIVNCDPEKNLFSRQRKIGINDILQDYLFEGDSPLIDSYINEHIKAIGESHICSIFQNENADYIIVGGKVNYYRSFDFLGYMVLLDSFKLAFGDDASVYYLYFEEDDNNYEKDEIIVEDSELDDVDDDFKEKMCKSMIASVDDFDFDLFIKKFSLQKNSGPIIETIGNNLDNYIFPMGQYSPLRFGWYLRYNSVFFIYKENGLYNITNDNEFIAELMDSEKRRGSLLGFMVSPTINHIKHYYTFSINERKQNV